jgi:NAD(P)-dependent dehydrogenase (short-subunit alcohol dehydrogenase family)
MTECAQSILVTGANRGIGLALAEAILDHGRGTHVWLGSRDFARGEQARVSLEQARRDRAGRITVVALDVADAESVREAAQQVRQTLGEASLYGIVNNAGIGFGTGDIRTVVEVNTRGPHRVCEAFLPLLDPARGRVVNVSSAAGPNCVASCAPERRRQLINPHIQWAQIQAILEEVIALHGRGADLQAHGWGSGSPYGLSKACLNAYTMALARQHPHIVVNACTPGFIETDLTLTYARSVGKTAEQLGLKTPAEGTVSVLHLLFGDPGGVGWFFGSDAKRSPLDRYRSPGDPPYRGDEPRTPHI